MWATWVPNAAVVMLGLTAAVYDVKTRRLPNSLTLGAAVAALVGQVALSGWAGVGLAAAGWAAGLALFFPVFALGGMGAGDVKLLAAVGAWLGPWGVLWTALYAALAGGVMALGVVLVRGYTAVAIRNLIGLLRAWSLGGLRPVEGVTLASSAGPRLPYALPIAVGAMAAIWLR